jgi:hypothetical protein
VTGTNPWLPSLPSVNRFALIPGLGPNFFILHSSFCIQSRGVNWFLTANPEESGFDLIPKLRGSLTTDDRMTGWALIPGSVEQTDGS